MAIANVQVASFPNAFSGSFGVNVTAGNTVFLYVLTYHDSGGTPAITSSGPLFNGATPSGSVKILELQSAYNGAASVYVAIWMMPNLAGGAASVGITSSGQLSTNVGLIAQEVSGLGTAPSLDKSSTGTAVSTAINSGASGSITANPEIVMGLTAGYGITLPGAGAPWNETTFGSNFVYTGYQIVSSGSFTYSMTGGSSQVWSAGVATVQGTAAPAVSAVAAFGDTDVSWEKLQLLGVV